MEAEDVLVRGHIYDTRWEKRIRVITGSFAVVPALISIRSRIFMDIHASLAMQFMSPWPPTSLLMHYVIMSAASSLHAASLLHVDFLRVPDARL